ncbi:hypothetical protein ABIA33_004263 [Streptacidiphilus sp. MAP12-16]|uniref:DUF4389 domain-containing protein n=1 Tax=Streptacidiphilus sp. MAP12-16 TaxID=3156300 RepID=UPI003515554D
MAYPSEIETGEWLPVLDIPEPAGQRRLTVLLRLLLVIPQIVVVFVLGLLAWVVTVIGWFAALVLGRLPGFAERFLAIFLAYSTRVNAYLMLLVDAYPPFAFRARNYPVAIELRPGRLNRGAVLFRIILAIPAMIVDSVINAGWWGLAFFCWLVVLILGRNPRPLFEATAAIARYTMRFEAYMMMLTSAYPKGLFGDRNLLQVPDAVTKPVATRPSATRPLLLSSLGTALLILFIVVGLLSSVSSSVTTQYDNQSAIQSAVWSVGSNLQHG